MEIIEGLITCTNYLLNHTTKKKLTPNNLKKKNTKSCLERSLVFDEKFDKKKFEFRTN